MTIKQRAQAIQNAQDCPRCTSWAHKRSDCKAKANSCGEITAGVKCQAEHSKLVHGIGNIYFAAADIRNLGKSQTEILLLFK